MTDLNNLENAVANWKAAKYNEDLYKQARLSAEEDIARLVNLEPGVNTFGGLKITVGNKETWEFDKMPRDYRANFFNEVTAYKPNTKKIKQTQADQPDIWAKLQEYQILTPRKNAFTVIKEKS